MTELYIKNMVCRRCIMAVENELVKLGLHPVKVDLGYVQLAEDEIAPSVSHLMQSNLNQLGFELLDTSKTRLIERVKNCIIWKIHYSERLDLKVNWSEIISAEVNHDYSSISSLFSTVEGITLEQFIIRQKIEKAKELLFYDELTLNEISYRLGYSSVQHLSSQFKRVTGQTPSQFKSSRSTSRRPIDSLV